jgi:hypothetical protein
MTKQWHPTFARLLRPLLEGHYEIKTNFPVGDAPGRRTSCCCGGRRKGRCRSAACGGT